MKLICHDLEDTQDVANDFIANELKPEKGRALLVALYGELGAGKTTFVQMIAKMLGIEERVTSPTFVIQKIYKIDSHGFTRFVHIDAYRLENGRELEKLGWQEILVDPRTIIFLEWPERVASVLPSERKNICFSHISPKEREIDLRYSVREE